MISTHSEPMEAANPKTDAERREGQDSGGTGTEMSGTNVHRARSDPAPTVNRKMKAHTARNQPQHAKPAHTHHKAPPSQPPHPQSVSPLILPSRPSTLWPAERGVGKTCMAKRPIWLDTTPPKFWKPASSAYTVASNPCRRAIATASQNQGARNRCADARRQRRINDAGAAARGRQRAQQTGVCGRSDRNPRRTAKQGFHRRNIGGCFRDLRRANF
jgi:hypothetical protein